MKKKAWSNYRPRKEVTPMKRVAPSQRMEQELFTAVQASGDPLGEAARRGAQMILQRVLEWEVEDYRAEAVRTAW